MLRPRNQRSHRLHRYAAALALTGLLFSQALPGAVAAPEARKIAFEAERARVRLMVELVSEPLAVMEALDPMASQMDLLKAEHQQLRFQLSKERIEHRVLSSHTKLFNGMAIEVKATDVARIAALPGVKQIHLSRKFGMPEPQLASSVSMIGVPQARGGGPGAPGVDGDGIKVAVIDTGIDYNHPDLGGCYGNGCRVIGGYDFVGDSFNGTNDPVPDSDPMDVFGHGTHVAGIIGAMAADPNGVTGVAPAVDLLALKIFGPSGFTWDNIIIQSLEAAWDMRVDVVNMSLGDAFTWPQDPSAQAARRLADRGVVVVASAGNNGPAGEYATGSPSNGPGSIAVASFENDMATRKGFLDAAGAPMGYGTMTYAPNLPASGQSAEVVFVGLGTSDADFLNPDGTSKVAGKVALMSRGAIPFREKSMRAQAHGAVQVLIHNNQAGFFGGTMAQPGDYIPTVSMSREDGLRLRSQIESGPVRLTFTGRSYQFVNETNGLISSFSSWGPTPDLAIKPDLTAPGGSIYATLPLAQGGYSSLSGTSMAAPHVAGAAALILQAKAAELAPLGNRARQEAVRALLMNTAIPRTMGAGSETLYPVHRQGAGMIDVFKAISAKQRVMPDKLSLGEMDGSFAAERRITVANTSNEIQLYTFELIGQGASLSASPETLRVRPGQTAQVWLNIALNPAMPDGLFYGWIALKNAAGERVAHTPYMGFKGDYQAATTLDPLDYGFPWLAQLADGYLYQMEAMDIYPGCNCEQDAAYLLFSLARQAQELRVEVIDMQTGRVTGHAYRADFQPRSAGDMEMVAFDGTVDNGRQLRPGAYQLRLRSLRPLGDRRNPAHWDTWTSGTVTIHR